MPTKVFDLDYCDLPAEIQYEAGYQQAFILLRYQGVPVQKVIIPFQGRNLSRESIRTAIHEKAGEEFWSLWLQEFIGYENNTPSESQPKPATIAVCTRDRPEDLKRCLEALLKLSDRGQEILVVDSASTTDTIRQIVDSFKVVRYCREEAPGLNRARNRALREARHEIVAFIDDDAIPDPGWLDALTKNFNHPRVVCVTGLTMPLEMETPAQEQFESYSTFTRGFARRVYRRSNLHPLAAGKAGAGVNMALLGTVLEEIGPFDERLDAGTPTRSGGDTEFFSRILASGRFIVYEPAALNFHRHRQSRKELRKTIFGYGVGVYAFWTKKLVEERELSVPYFALEWFFLRQIPGLLRSIFLLPGRPPLDLIAAELLGCIQGPGAFFRSRSQQKDRVRA